MASNPATHIRPSKHSGVVVGLFLRGHREPLPLFPGLSHALGTKQNTTSSSWIDNRGDGDGNDEWIQVAFDDADFHTITSLAVRDDDPEGEGDDRATRYATHLWDIVKQSSPGTELKL
ncbi:MAG: hypothetical protein M5U19_21660 [Microthrixaceae bacterium]|nr:hypothetical protein [Microthrixaceae bacterium]